MAIADVVGEIDKEMERLNQAKTLLTGNNHGTPMGMPKTRRVISAAGRRKIAIAQRARWAKVRKAA